MEVFVSKLNSTGTALIYSTFIGGTSFDFGRAIAIDAAGNAYIAGQTKSSNFPTTGGAFDRTFNIGNCPRCGVDQYDAFVTKLNATGSALVYSTFLGGTDLDDALGIAVDSAGNAYVTGETGSVDFPTTAGAFDRTRDGAFDAFVTKLNATGSALVYSTFIGGAEVDFGQHIVLAKDGSNNAFVMGSTRSANFPTTPGAFDTTENGAFDVFIAKLNTAGSALLYSTFLGGSDMDSGGGLTVDLAGNAYIAGGTISVDFPTTPGAFDRVPKGNDAFVTKLNPSGSALVYSTLLGGTSSDGAGAIALNSAGNAVVAGGTSSTDFPVTAGAAQRQFGGGGSDVFVTAFNADASAIVYSTYLGGTDSDGASDLALDSSDRVYLTGQTLSSDFPTTPGALDRVFNGDPLIFWGDAFVTKLNITDAPTQPPPPASLSSVSVTPTTVVGGNTSTGTVGLSSGAPSGGIVVSLASSHAAAVVPSTITVAAGASSATFPITTTSVAASTSVTITATAAGVTRTAALTVNPQTQGGTLTVTATGRNGERVTSTPAGINLATGSSQTASFTAGTSITLRVSNNRDAIWSGACSSGGSKVKTCTLTASGNQSVTANVQ